MTKKRTTKNKTDQEIIRFREIGKDLIAEVREDRTARKGKAKKYRVQIEALLLEILEKIEKSKAVEHKAVLLESLFEILGIYFKTKAHEEGAPVLKQIQEKLSSVAAIFKQEKKLKKSAEAQAVGQFVEALFHFGMPREYAIPAVAEWLPFGDSTVRNANQNYYRKKGSELAKSKNFESRFRSSPHMPMFIGWFSKYKKLPTTHPTAGKAFQKMHEIVRVEQKSREEWDNKIRLFKRSLPT
jgi:hypothetical protein